MTEPEGFVGAGVMALGTPGPLRDRLVRAVLDGRKTATTALAVFYEVDGEALPTVGARSTLIDSAGRPVGTVETTAVAVVPLGDVGLDVAVAEGEGFTSVRQWRAHHEAFWGAFLDRVREALGRPDWDLDDATPVVVEHFRTVEPPPRGG